MNSFSLKILKKMIGGPFIVTVDFIKENLELNQELLPLGGIWFLHCIIFLSYCMFDYLYEKFASWYDMIQFKLLYIYVCASLIWLWIEVRDLSIQLLLKILDTSISISALIWWFLLLLSNIKNRWFKKCP